MECYVRIVEPVPRSSSIPPTARGAEGGGPSLKDGGGFFTHFQEADHAARIPRALFRRQERQRKESENGLYPNRMLGVEIGPYH
jgi:hypothetical protein